MTNDQEAILALTQKVRELEAELKTANHWRERHSRDAEAYGIQSNENWKRAKALEEEVARLTPLVADGGALREAVERFVFELDHGTYGGPNEEYVRGGGDQRRRLANKLRAALASAEPAAPVGAFVGSRRGPDGYYCNGCGGLAVRVATREREPLVLDDAEPPPESPESDERIVDGLMREAQAGRGERAIERREPEAAEQGRYHTRWVCPTCGRVAHTSPLFKIGCRYGHEYIEMVPEAASAGR